MDRWTLAAAITDGRVFRRMNRHGRITGGSLSDEGVYLVVGTYPPQICLWLAPLTHGGRLPRWCHSSVATTERYLGVEQDLTDSASDHVQLLL